MNGLAREDKRADRDEFQRLFDKYDEKREEAEKRFFENERDFNKTVKDIQQKMNDARKRSGEAQRVMKSELDKLEEEYQDEKKKIESALGQLNRQRDTMKLRGVQPSQDAFNAKKKQLLSKCNGVGQAAIDKELERRAALKSQGRYKLTYQGQLYQRAKNGRGELEDIGVRARNRCMSMDPEYVQGLEGAQQEYEAVKRQFEDTYQDVGAQIQSLNQALQDLINRYGKKKLAKLDEAREQWQNAENDIEDAAKEYAAELSTFQKTQYRTEQEVKKNLELADKTHKELESVKDELKKIGGYSREDVTDRKDNAVKAGRAIQQIEEIEPRAISSKCCQQASRYKSTMCRGKVTRTENGEEVEVSK